MKLYSMALTANKVVEGGVKVEVRVGSVLAENKDEATGKAFESAKVTFPSSDEWHSQSIVIAEVPQWQLDELNQDNDR